MLNLENTIAEWRKQMLAAGIKTPVPLEELESHLREEIQRQMESGLDGQAAFNLAARNIGGADALRKEFGKVGDAMSARQRKFNIIFCGVAAVLLGLTGIILLCSSYESPISLSFPARLSMPAAFVSAALILWSWRFSYRFFPVLSKRTRINVALLCVVLSCPCILLLLHFIELSDNIVVLITGFAWMMIPPALAASIINALEEAAYRKTAVSNL